MTQKTERIRKNILKLGFLEKFIEFQKFIDLRARAPAAGTPCNANTRISCVCPNSIRKYTDFLHSIKKLDLAFFMSLASSHAVLSMIFGILGKFWIDIGENIFSRFFFRDEKCFPKMLFSKILENFWKIAL